MANDKILACVQKVTEIGANLSLGGTMGNCRCHVEFPDSDIPMASAVKHRGAAGHQFPGYAAVRVD